MTELAEAGKMILTIQQLPPAECSPNSRVHWTVIKKAADNFRWEVWAEAKKHWQFACLDRANISLTIVVKEKRRRDPDNWWARFKPGADALVQAGVMLDDDAEHLQHGDIIFIVDPSRAPQTIIEIKPVK